MAKLSVGNKTWSDRINALWDDTIGGTVKGFIAVGGALEEAHIRLSSDDYEDMIQNRLRFGARTAERLRAVSKDGRLATHESLLPPHWTTLYEITKLDDSEFDQALKDGTIRSDMERKDVPRKRKEPPPAGSGNAVSDESVGDTVPPVAEAQKVALTADDGEGGDNVVTGTEENWGDWAFKESGERSLPTERSEPERLFDPDSGAPQKPERAAADESEASARLAAAAEPQGGPDRAFQADPADGAAGESPASILANGLAMAISASKELSPDWAIKKFPRELMPSADDVTALLQWLYRFEKLFRNQFITHHAAD